MFRSYHKKGGYAGPLYINFITVFFHSNPCYGLLQLYLPKWDTSFSIITSLCGSLQEWRTSLHFLPRLPRSLYWSRSKEQVTAAVHVHCVFWFCNAFRAQELKPVKALTVMVLASPSATRDLPWSGSSPIPYTTFESHLWCPMSAHKEGKK